MAHGVRLRALVVKDLDSGSHGFRIGASVWRRVDDPVEPTTGYLWTDDAAHRTWYIPDDCLEVIPDFHTIGDVETFLEE